MVLTAAVLIIKVIGFANKFWQNGILTGDGVGVYGRAYALFNVVYAIAVAGFPTAISKIIVGYQKEGRYQDIRRTIRVANRFFLLIGIVGSAILILLANVYATSILKNPNITLAIIVVAPSILFSCMMCTHRGYYQGMRNMVPTAVSQVVEAIIKCVVSLLGAYLVRSYFSNEFVLHSSVLGVGYPNVDEASVAIYSLAAAGAMLGVTISTFGGWVYLLIRRRIDRDWITEEQLAKSPEAQTDRYLLKQILMIGLPITLAAAASQIASTINDAIIQAQLVKALNKDPGALFASHGNWLLEAGKSVASVKKGEIATFLSGCYDYAIAFFSLVPAITGSLCTSVLPHVADSWLAKDIERTKGHINATLKLTMMIAAPMGFGIAALGRPILHVVYSKTPAEVAIGGTTLSVLGVAAVFLTIYTVSNTMLQAIGRFDLPVKLVIAGNLMNIALTYILVGIPSINIKGAPIGNLVAYIIIAVLSLYYLYRITKIPFDVKGSLLKPMLAGLISGASAYLVYEAQYRFLYDVIKQKFITVISVVFAVIVYIIALGLLKVVTKMDLESMPGGRKIGKILEKLRIVR